MAEAYTGDSYVSSSRWKLRLIGSYNPLPSLSRDFPSNSFAIKEIRDYYIPNDKKILFRYKYMTEGGIVLFKVFFLLHFYIFIKNKFCSKILSHLEFKFLNSLGNNLWSNLTIQMLYKTSNLCGCIQW